jgi:2-keto-4-pentenoate hydratase/2-oxohepta-3-ene-1,7-dioic acid hydratase in catechol pathway
MKLASFRKGQETSIGVVNGDRIVDLSVAAPNLPREMTSLIAGFDALREVVRAAARSQSGQALSDVELLAPIARPGKILAIGLNYADHIAETGRPVPTDQTWFCKTANTVNGPFSPVQLPRVSTMVDYEAELVVVIGKRCRHVSKDEAKDVVFGYTAGNDVSVRDWQYRTAQWVLGKSFDTHAPMGPWIVTADEIGDPHTLGIRCFVNAEKRQDSNTKHLIFGVYDLISYLSQAMTLEPGDVLFTGTPGGVGMAMSPQRFLAAGDVVRVEIDRIGAIESTVTAE